MKKKSGFEKFINPKTNAKKKEEFRQEKRKAKTELRAYGEEMRREKFAKDRGDKFYKEDGESRNNNRFQSRKPYKKFGNRDESFKPIKCSFQNSEEDLADRFDKPSKFDKSKRFQKSEEKNFRPKRASFAEQREFASHPKKTFRREKFQEEKQSETMPLNKFISHSGVCGRREAAEMVKQGFAKVNGDVVFEPGYKVSAKDKVELKDKLLTLQEKLVYVLMNKPKDHITTTEDDKGRKTVTDLVKKHIEERIYPVGRLDRNTTGVLLLTNDGELAQKLMHPSFEVKKIYEATLDKPLSKTDAEKIMSGIELEDGLIKADSLGYADVKDKRVVGIEIHSGKNHIVKRIFMHLGYSVTKLDRVMFANLTKKNVERGRWRFLNEREIRSLKSMNQGGRFAGKSFMNK